MSIEINKFVGMNNLDDSDHFFAQEGVAQPRIILNSDVTNSKTLIARDGQTKVIDLTDGHSEFGGVSCHLVMDGTVLKRIEGKTATAIQDIGGTQDYMYYAEVEDKVYMSNRYFNGIFNPESNTIDDWGITLPVGPVLSSASGGLPAGTYHVCFTQKSGDNISGNGPITKIALTSEGNISISNRPSGAVVWCTDPDGDIFYHIGEVDEIVNIPSIEPLPSLFCYPPPYLRYIIHAFGRLWGARDNILYYSDSFHLDWWKIGTAFFEFATDITLIAKVKTGLFVGCEDRTYCLLGTKPEEMQQSDVGAGAIPGSLAYCNDIIELGDTISPPEKKHHSVPVWVSKEGIVAGNPSGRVFSLSQGRVKFAPGERGASLYRNKNGQFQFMTSFAQGGELSTMGLSDEATVTVMRNGKVI